MAVFGGWVAARQSQPLPDGSEVLRFVRPHSTTSVFLTGLQCASGPESAPETPAHGVGGGREVGASSGCVPAHSTTSQIDTHVNILQRVNVKTVEAFFSRFGLVDQVVVLGASSSKFNVTYSSGNNSVCAIVRFYTRAAATKAVEYVAEQRRIANRLLQPQRVPSQLLQCRLSRPSAEEQASSSNDRNDRNGNSGLDLVSGHSLYGFTLKTLSSAHCTRLANYFLGHGGWRSTLVGVDQTAAGRTGAFPGCGVGEGATTMSFAATIKLEFASCPDVEVFGLGEGTVTHKDPMVALEFAKKKAITVARKNAFQQVSLLLVPGCPPRIICDPPPEEEHLATSEDESDHDELKAEL